MNRRYVSFQANGSRLHIPHQLSAISFQPVPRAHSRNGLCLLNRKCCHCREETTQGMSGHLSCALCHQVRDNITAKLHLGALDALNAHNTIAHTHTPGAVARQAGAERPGTEPTWHGRVGGARGDAAVPAPMAWLPVSSRVPKAANNRCFAALPNLHAPSPLANMSFPPEFNATMQAALRTGSLQGTRACPAPPYPFPPLGTRTSGGAQVQTYWLFFKHICPVDPNVVCSAAAAGDRGSLAATLVCNTRIVVGRVAMQAQKRQKPNISSGGPSRDGIGYTAPCSKAAAPPV